MEITIRNAHMTVTATTAGAELLHVSVDGRERLWQNEDGSWAGHAPILFPVCGANAVRLGGVVFPCPFHGFARRSEFSVVEATERSVRFRLLSDDETKKLYPFDFRFDVCYTLEERGIHVLSEIGNEGQETLYATLGSHDSFALDELPSAYYLRFDEPERFDSYLTESTAHLTGEVSHLGAGRDLDLETPILDAGSSICLDHLRSRGVTLVRKATGEAVARVVYPDTDKLILWHPAGARMLCIEPWQTMPDRVGDEREFPDKDGVLAVPAGGVARITRALLYGGNGAAL